MVFLLLGERAVEHALDGFLVGLHHGIDIFRSAGAPLNLEHAHAALHHAVDEAHGLQVLGTHDILVVNLQLGARLAVGDEIRAAAYLHAGPAVG